MIDFFQAITQHVKGKITEEAIQRANVCADCPLKEKRSYSDFLNSQIVEINGFVCSKCDCPLATKIFAKDKKHICDKWGQPK